MSNIIKFSIVTADEKAAELEEKILYEKGKLKRRIDRYNRFVELDAPECLKEKEKTLIKRSEDILSSMEKEHFYYKHLH